MAPVDPSFSPPPRSSWTFPALALGMLALFFGATLALLAGGGGR